MPACQRRSQSATGRLIRAAGPADHPRIRRVTSSKVGNEVVLFRHEKTFYHKPGFFFLIKDSEDPAAITAKVKEIDAFNVNYVGIDLTVDGFAVKSEGDGAAFAAAVAAVRAGSKRPLILIGDDPAVLADGLAKLEGEKPLIATATPENWEAMADLAIANKASLVVTAGSLEEIAELTPKIKEKGLSDLVIDPQVTTFNDGLVKNTIHPPNGVGQKLPPLRFPDYRISLSGAAAQRLKLPSPPKRSPNMPGSW